MEQCCRVLGESELSERAHRKIIREFHKTSAIERKNIVARIFPPLKSTGFESSASFVIPKAGKFLIIHSRSESQCEWPHGTAEK